MTGYGAGIIGAMNSSAAASYSHPAPGYAPRNEPLYEHCKKSPGMLQAAIKAWPIGSDSGKSPPSISTLLTTSIEVTSLPIICAKCAMSSPYPNERMMTPEPPAYPLVVLFSAHAPPPPVPVLVVPADPALEFCIPLPPLTEELPPVPRVVRPPPPPPQPKMVAVPVILVDLPAPPLPPVAPDPATPAAVAPPPPPPA